MKKKQHFFEIELPGGLPGHAGSHLVLHISKGEAIFSKNQSKFVIGG